MKTEDAVPDKHLVSRFVSMQKSGAFPPLDLSGPLQLVAMTYSLEPFNLVASANELAFNFPSALVYKRHSTTPKGVRPAQVVNISIAQISGLEAVERGDYFSGTPWSRSDPLLELRLSFSQTTALGKEYEFYAEPRTVLTLVRWMESGKTRME